MVHSSGLSIMKIGIIGLRMLMPDGGYGALLPDGFRVGLWVHSLFLKKIHHYGILLTKKMFLLLPLK